LECCFEEFSENISANRKIDYLTHGRIPLLEEWLKRSQARGRKVRSLNNVEEQTKGSGSVGTIEGLTKEGYLKIRTETGEILKHVSGDIIELREGQ
jgi:biotin-(acetyl-CoA carboxylase) ligase